MQLELDRMRRGSFFDPPSSIGYGEASRITGFTGTEKHSPQRTRRHGEYKGRGYIKSCIVLRPVLGPGGSYGPEGKVPPDLRGVHEGNVLRHDSTIHDLMQRCYRGVNLRDNLISLVPA